MADTGPEIDRKPRPSTVLKRPEPNSGGVCSHSKDAANSCASAKLGWQGALRGDGPPYIKLGRSIRYGEGALVQWMKSRVRLSTSER